MKRNTFSIMVVLLCVNFTIQAQSRFSILPTVGIATPILDNGLGFQLGVNPSLAIRPNFYAEGQLSYTYINTTAFISGEAGSSSSFYALIGGRFYLTPETKKIRPYINGLVGGFSSNDSDGNLGFSVGGFIEMRRTVIGISFESTQNLVLKLGRVF